MLIQGSYSPGKVHIRSVVPYGTWQHLSERTLLHNASTQTIQWKVPVHLRNVMCIVCTSRCWMLFCGSL